MTEGQTRKVKIRVAKAERSRTNNSNRGYFAANKQAAQSYSVSDSVAETLVEEVESIIRNRKNLTKNRQKYNRQFKISKKSCQKLTLLNTRELLCIMYARISLSPISATYSILATQQLLHLYTENVINS